MLEIKNTTNAFDTVFFPKLFLHFEFVNVSVARDFCSKRHLE